MKFVWALLRALLWLGFMIFTGLLVGLMVVVMPPLAWIAVIALSIVVLLWVMPNLHLIPEGLMRKLFITAVIVQFCVPVYYAFAVQGLPWISIRRVTWFTMIICAGFMIAGSDRARRRIHGAIASAKAISVPAIGFIACIFLSILTSTAWTESLRDTSEALLYWMMALVTCLLCIETEDDIRFLLKALCCIAVVGGVAGFVEYLMQRHFIVLLWPQAMIERLFADSPQLYENIVRNVIRNGQFRSNFIYNVSLSYGEFLAACAPLCLFFAFHPRTRIEGFIGVFGTIACIMGIFASGSRGAYLGISVALPLFVTFWILRFMKEQPNSLVGSIATVTLAGFIAGFVTLALSWQRLQVLFTGGYEGAGSTDTRFTQWALAKPWILSNPITGHGQGLGALVVGYYTPGNNIPSLDSYVISLLVEIGIPGLLMFFFMIAASIIILLKIYLKDQSPSCVCSAAIATAILSFGLYRLALSQRENHVLFFLLVGLAVVQTSISRRRALAGGPTRSQSGIRPRSTASTPA